MIDELTQLEASVDRDPGDVAKRASELSGSARVRGCSRDLARACTTLARARRNLGEVDAASAAIDEALVQAQVVGGDVLADAHLVAASITTFRDDASLTAHHLDEADRHGSPAMRQQVLLQRAVLAKRAGRLDEALGLYERTLPALRAAGDHVVVARVLSNRAYIDVLRGRPRAALRDFDEARTLFIGAGQRFGAMIVTENMAWAHVTLGDVPEALALLDEACEEAAAHEHQLQDAVISKAEALMAAGVFIEAIELLAGVAEVLGSTGDRRGVAEAMLLQAEAARLAGLQGGRELAQQARTILSEVGADGFANHAHLELLRATVAAGDCGALDEVEDLARRLDSTGPARIEVEAWALATQLALAGGQRRRARRAAEHCARKAAEMPFVEHRLAAAHAAASVEASDDQIERALTTVVDVLDEFDRYRDAIGSPDARSGSMLHSKALLELGAGLVAETRSAERILAWSEQRRCAVPTWMPTLDAARRQRDRTDDTSMDELRSVMSELRESETSAPPSGRSVSDLMRRRRQLEQELCVHGLGARRRRPATPTATVAPDLGDHVGVSLDVHGDHLLAIVVESGRARLVDIGDRSEVQPIVDAVGRLQTARARAEGEGRVHASTTRRLDAAVELLDRNVVRRLDLADGPVVLAMPRELHALPWSSTPTLRDRAVSLVPSLSWWSAVGPVRGLDGGSTTAIAGPRLEHAVGEVAAVCREHREARAVVDAEATCDALVDAFATSRIVHVAAHARLRHDNPMWSTIELADGPLLLYQLARRVGTPDLVVMSTCHSGVGGERQGVALPGFAAALLELGVRSVVATTSLLPDSPATRDTVAALHAHVARGAPVAEALRLIRRREGDAVAADALVAWGRS